MLTQVAKLKADTYGDWSDSQEKSAQRDAVVNFLLMYHPRRFPMRYFGLPGEKCHAERQIEHLSRSSPHFIGVENRIQVMQRIQPWMVGDGGHPFRHPLKNGYIDGIKTLRHKVMFFDLVDFLRLGRQDKLNPEAYARRFKKWTCCWLDTCSPIGSKLIDGISVLDNHLSTQVIQAPVAISFLIGRDSGPELTGMCEHISDPFQRRVQIIETILSTRTYRSFKLLDAFTHEGKGQSTKMGTVCGVMPLRSESEMKKRVDFSVGVED